MRSAVIITLGLFGGIIDSNAWAQSSVTERAKALFDHGVAEMEAGNLAKACPQLAKSYQLYAHDATLVALADCEDRAGHAATAIGFYEQYLINFEFMDQEQKGKHAARAKKAEERRKTLLSALTSMAIKLPANLPSNAKLFRDGREIALSAAELEIPIDPGEHRVVLQLPNGASIERQVRIKSGEHVRVEIELPVTEDQTPSEAFPPDPFPASSASPPPGEETPSEELNGQNPYRTWAIVSGGVAGAGLITGAILGGLAWTQKGIKNLHCTAIERACDHEGFEAVNLGRTYAHGSTVSFVVGSAALGGMLYFLLSGNPSSKAPKPHVSAGILNAGPSGMRMGVSGTFN